MVRKWISQGLLQAIIILGVGFGHLAQAQSPPDLSEFDNETRKLFETACTTGFGIYSGLRGFALRRSRKPNHLSKEYRTCIREHLNDLNSLNVIVNLHNLDKPTKDWIKEVCFFALQTNSVGNYVECVEFHLSELPNSKVTLPLYCPRL